MKVNAMNPPIGVAVDQIPIGVPLFSDENHSETTAGPSTISSADPIPSSILLTSSKLKLCAKGPSTDPEIKLKNEMIPVVRCPNLLVSIPAGIASSTAVIAYTDINNPAWLRLIPKRSNRIGIVGDTLFIMIPLETVATYMIARIIHAYLLE